MAAVTVSVEGVQHRYGSAVVLDVDRLVIPPGSTAILGPNGSGKTTLLRALATVATIQRGHVFVDGASLIEPVSRLHVRRRLGYVSQHDRLPARMRVGEFCDYVAALKEISPARHRRRWTAHVLTNVGLQDQARSRIGKLSGGMQRRLSIAQSLIGDPDLLVLDEPLVSLDADYRSAVVQMIAASTASRTTITATHHADELASTCGHVIVLLDGRVVFGGSPIALAEQAAGRVWETNRPIDHPAVRAVGPNRFRILGIPPPGVAAVEPGVHDGYLALVHGVSA